MEEQRVRISDIAEELGVSTATVSNVIHGKTQKISDQTVKRVLQLIEEREYLPGRADILFAQNASKIIGIFVNDHEKYEGHTLEDGFIASSLNDLSEEIEHSGQFMMVKKAKSAEEIIRFASMWNMDGIVVIGFCEQDYMELRNHMRIPFVIYDGFCENPERILNITLDNYDGGYQVGCHFRELGHEKALCIADNEIGVDRERLEGFQDGFWPKEVRMTDRRHSEEAVRRLLIPMKKQERWEFYMQKLDMFQNVSAVFAVSDYYAIDLMCFLNMHGIRVPEEISVAGFDDTPMCRMVYPALTTVKQDGRLRAALAIEKLRELKEKKLPDTRITLPVSLVVRQSTGKARKSKFAQNRK